MINPINNYYKFLIKPFQYNYFVNNNTEILLINLDLEERIIKEIIANYKIITKFIICSKVFV